ncbi:MAG: TonB-dependent receptor [Vicinamibacterales bacterium]
MLMRRMLWVAILICVCPAAALAQDASFGGRIADAQGGTVNGAVVTLTASTAPTPRTTRSGADGSFSFDAVPPGTINVMVEAPGFERWTQMVTVSATSAPLAVVLRVAGVAETVAVVAPKLEEELPQLVERAGARVQTITSAQIRNGGYNDVAQALQALVPGLFMSPTAGAFGYVTASLQGSRSNEILWLVDGVRISNRLYNTVTPLDTLPAHMVERIEVIEGGQGLFYGTQAVAGVINIVTKGFSDAANAQLQTGFNTNRGRSISVLGRDSRAGHRFVVYGSSDQADGFQLFPTADLQPSATDRRRSYDVVTFGGKYAYDFTPALRFSTSYQFSDVSLDLLRPTATATRFNERGEHIASMKLDFQPQPMVELFFKGYYHAWDSFYSQTNNVVGSPGTIDLISAREYWGFSDYGANLLAKLTPTRGFEYFAGYDFQNYKGEDVVLLIAPNTETVHAIFGQVRTTRDLLRNATVSAGVRYNAPTNSEGKAVWSLSGRYDFASWLFARAGVGTAFRYPDAYELFAIDPSCCAGNPNLKPESSTNFNASVGTRVQGGETIVDLEVITFYREVKDLILDVDDGTGSGNTVTANTTDAVRVKGVSFVGSASLTPAVSGSLGYTYTTSELGNQIAGGYSAIPGLPSNQVESSVDLHPAMVPFGATLAVNWVGETFDTVSGFGNVPSGKYAVVNLGTRVFLDARRQHRLNFRFENLLDKTYTTAHGRGFTDVGGNPYLFHNLGTPRTFHMSYSFSY